MPSILIPGRAGPSNECGCAATGPTAYPYWIRGSRADAARPRNRSVILLTRRALAREPAQPQGRNGRGKPTSTSLFEWALSLEREKEEETVGAGR